MLRHLFNICSLLVLTFTATPGHAQSSSNAQLWFEHMMNYPFANSFNLENTFVYSTLLESPRWYSLEYTPTLEYGLGKHFDLVGAATLSYTLQAEDHNTFEIRPVVGTRIHITPARRVLTRLYLRVDQRHFLNLETREWQRTLRPRVRAESLIPINKDSYFHDGLWYGIADVELLFSVEDVDERFANRIRIRTGIGYRLSYSSRFEFIYMIQESKHTVYDDFTSTDNIFRFRYKHYLNKAKPTKMSGSGN